jgi:2,4-dienoyl-CoA reductase-like NADH-dependent reductase (Old Yellow Enzyme family)
MNTLFDETKINGMLLKNRLVRSATHEAMADENGFPTERLYKLYERLAKGGVGLIISGYTYVSRDGKSDAMLGIDSDQLIPNYRELVNQVHQNGARIAMQINHCGRQTTKEMTGSQPIAPSAVKEKVFLVNPREMTEEDIERVIEAFAQSARRVKEIGFDALQLHAAHGFLINQFLCPHTNRRDDRWGGSIENRMRFLKMIYEKCRTQVGGDYPILIKINAYDYMKNGLKQDEGFEMAKSISDMGFDGIEISCGIAEDGGSTVRGDLPLDVILDEWDMYKRKNFLFRSIMKRYGNKIIKPVPFSLGYNIESAKRIKDSVDIPVFVVGGMVDPAAMEETIENGNADYISLSRALITDPNFPNKIKEGDRKPSRCIHCNLCLYYLASKPVRCYHGKRLKKA